uniref:Uncharacterized protein n=1 Tax=Arundo donax TaxID=35708 RepID=A0A0A8YSH8_ARUDO
MTLRILNSNISKLRYRKSRG